MKKGSNLFRGLAGIFLALLVIVEITGVVANSWSGKVNELLGITASTIERSDDPEDYLYRSDFDDPSDLVQAEIDLNTRLAAEGSVVLKGLPALDGTKVTLFGMRSGEKMQFGGSMGELVDASNVVTLADAMTANGFSVNPDMVQFYKDMASSYAPSRSSGGNVVSSYEGQGAAIGEVPVSEYNAALIGDYTDAAVVVFGRDAGESACFYPGLNGLSNPAEFSGSPTGNILSLSNEERELLNWVKGQGFNKIVVLLNSSTSMEIEELKTDAAVHSIVWIGNPGAYGTYGIAKLLSGEVLPSGHLPDTFAVNSALSPAAQNFGIYNFANADAIETTTNNALRSSWYLVEAESIYTGYKYYETRYFDSVLGQGNATTAAHGEAVSGNTWSYDNEVSYTFGYGVEGSTFAEKITDANIDWTGVTDSTVTVEVTNTGAVAAKHAVQLYVSVPYTDNDRVNGVEKSAIQLIGYAKTGEAQETTFADVVLLNPGESEQVTITFNAQDFYSYDMSYAHDGVTGAYVLSAGDYYFATGNGAHDAVQAVLKAMRPDLTGDLQPTGTVQVESLAAEAAITESNGVTVRNQLDGSDLNSWNSGTTVTYLTRNDWAGTFPVSVNSITATDEMIAYLRNAFYDAATALSEYDGPTQFTYDADNGVKVVDLVGLDYDDPLYEQVLDEMSLQDLINQYLGFKVEIKSIAFPLENLADSPLGFIGTIGQRSSGSIYEVSSEDPAYGHYTNVYVGAPTVAATFSPFLQAEEGRLIGNDALWTGYTTWYGPGLNLHRTPYNGRNIAYYSEDAVLTGMAATYVHQSLIAKGVVTNAKHFAFNDQETNRDGIAVFLSEQAARENELRGFQIPVRDGSMKGLMSAFNRIGLTHVAAHAGLMNGILRGEWGWNGFMITDSVKSAQYFLPRETLLASNDMMLGGSNNGAAWSFTTDTVSQDPVVQAGIREAFHRRLYFYANSVLLNGITPDARAAGGMVWWELTLLILGIVTGIGFAACFVLYVMKAWKENGGKGSAFELTASIVVLALSVAGCVLFAMSYTTGYYIFGQMQSGLIAALVGAAIVAELAAILLQAKLPENFWAKLLTFCVTALLAAAAMLLVGDRVEGIGNCIVTDYDSGHGGEEAIYMSLAGSVLMLAAVVYNIIGSFASGKAAEKKPVKNAALVRNVCFGVSAAIVLLAVLIPTWNLVNPTAAPGGPSGTGSGGTYTVSFNQANGNADTMPSYQFLCSNLKGMIQADSRFYIDVTLTLDGEGGYKLLTDSYVIENGERAVVGDPTGLGLVLTTEAEGTYTDNGDGTVTTSVPTHAVFTMETDTYSSQMKGAAQMNVGGNDADGVYDSETAPAVLDFVPETVWTLSGSSIVTYRDANAGGAYTISFNQANGNTEDMPNYQFLCSDLSGMVRADSRFYIDVALMLDGSNYTLSVDSYVIENGERAVVGDPTGLGLVLTMNATGTYTENADGTVTTSVPTHAVFEMQTDTYSSQMKGAAQMNVAGNDADGVYDSSTEPAVLDFVPETVWTLDGSAIVSYTNANGGDSQDEEPATTDGLTITSDDGATTMTFYADGTYLFAFEAYGVEDPGTYTYDGTTLTVTNAAGTAMTADGDPLLLHYISGVSDMLTGDFTINASDLAALLSGGGETGGASLTVISDDGATKITFNADGTYVFAFEAYGVEDAGTYTYDGTTLTVTNAAGTAMTAEGDPLALHYISGVSDMLTGDFTISASDLAALLSGGGETGGASLTVTSDDGATKITFNADGTYVFAFEAYGVEDPGTYTYDGTTLTVVNGAGTAMTAEGDPLLLHYISGVSDMLTGDFTIKASDLAAVGGADAAKSLTVTSDDGATTITFNADGTYVFAFAAYGVEDAGTYTYDGTTLTVTNATGAEMTAEGDPLALHYISGVSDMLTGDFTISAADLAAVLSGGVTVTSDDGATSMTFYADGTFRFAFDAYGVEDLGTYTYDGTTLTVTNANGDVVTAEGDPLHFHYVTAVSDMLTGDFTVSAADLG